MGAKSLIRSVHWAHLFNQIVDKKQLKGGRVYFTQFHNGEGMVVWIILFKVIEAYCVISDIYPDHQKEVRPACMALSSEMLLATKWEPITKCKNK